ncbi:lantibiotic dehydratase [Nonomuraea sp. NEAU-A123]|uniref:lantibiotic dehydratase n=1 Tax=Nonomuraea sp. NEAU-A123 TaxID=2839649 RepID=UPI001BE49955|nr:lantibiotic dehydratase [Nonomuraea sp. NEAU-A123]MBT2226593.1 thiopeptide-type bacteriocin biosynthesis protein [Nonomuraea sp. NEAU-A123]
MNAQRSQPYRHLDAALIRATAHPGEPDLPPWPEQDGEAGAERWREWLAQVWARDSVAAAVSMASPALASQIEAVCTGRRPRAGRLRRMALSLARYLVRMRARATPFGTFAGVTPLRFNTTQTGRTAVPHPGATLASDVPHTGAALMGWTGVPRTRTTADGVWLAAVIARLESGPELRRRLPVVVNDLAFVRGERLVVPWQPHAGDPARSELSEVSVRHGPAVRTVMDLAQGPIQIGELIDGLAAAFPGARVPAIEVMVAELVTCGALITSLRPPSTSPDGLAYVLDRLGDVAADAFGEVTPLVRELRAIHEGLRAADHATGEAAVRARRAVADRMRAALPVEVVQPLKVDLRLDGTVVLPPEVAAEAESAAGALLRLTPHPAGHPAWREYHVRFLDRYGAGAVVPVEQLVDDTAGLGFPAHYGEPRQPAEPLSRRDQRLLALAQQAALDGAREIVLDDATIESLAADGMDDAAIENRARPLPYMELVAEVCASTAGALATGAFSMTVLAVDGTAACLSGRFVDMLPDGDRRRMAGLYDRLPVSVDGAVPVQLSFPARNARTQEVARTPLLLPELITLAEHRADSPGRIPWRDLAVTADNDRMYLLSRSRRQVVEPVLTSAVARRAMPPIARLLFEIPRARGAVVSPFSWGAAACLPFLPRVRYGRSVLAPARWRIPAEALPGPDTAWPDWARAMTDLRARLRLPTTVSVGTEDRRLRLDLDEPMSLALLRAHLDGAGEAAVVSEAAGPADHGWFGRRAHEIVISLAATTQAARAPAAVTVPGPLSLVRREDGILPGALHLVGCEDGVLPGARVLFAKLYGHPGVVDTILTKHLPELLETWDEPPMWWFVRYRDPRPHLRLRLHLAGRHDYGPAAARVGAWAADLRGRGLVGDLVLDTYHPETARYGSGEVLAAAEAAFAADSAAVVAQLAALSAARQVHPHALTAASLVDLTAALAKDQAAGARWQIEHPPSGPAPANDRAVVRQAVGLADLSEDRAALRAIQGGPRIVAAWQDRRRAMAAYMDRLAADAPHLSESAVVESFMHMHHLRALGIDRDVERRCRKLARAIALSFAARHDAAPYDGAPGDAAPGDDA